MRTVETFTATIYLGLREGYTDVVHSIDEVEEFLQAYCDSRKDGLCVTVTKTKFIYTGGFDDGVAIGLIKYPRFVRNDNTIRIIAFEIAYKLREEFKQNRVSLVFPDKTSMIGPVK